MLKESPKAVPRECSLQQSWSSFNCVRAIDMAEPVQPDPSHGSWVATHAATRPREYLVSHGWEIQQEAQGKR